MCVCVLSFTKDINIYLGLSAKLQFCRSDDTWRQFNRGSHHYGLKMGDNSLAC